jgi:Ca-activated chloride channel family protein
MTGGFAEALFLSGWTPWIFGVGAATIAIAFRGLAVYRARADRNRLADTAILETVSRPPSEASIVVRFLLLAIGAGSLAAVLVGTSAEQIASEAGSGLHEIVLVLDASNSMLVEDVAPSRVSLQRAVARRLVGEIDARFGVVYFAGGGYVLSPLTEDRDATLMFTETVDPSVVGRGGTSLPAGLSQGLAVLSGGQASLPKALVLLSDGEATAGDTELEAVLAEAASRNIPIHTVGFGTAEGARIPMPLDRVVEQTESGMPTVARPDPGAGGRTWLRDAEGRPVVSRLQEPSLRQIAGSTNGLYVPANDAGVDALLQRLPKLGAGSSSSATTLALLLVAFGALFAEAYLFRRA